LLQDVPEIDRATFIMRVQHDLPYAEISRALGVSPTAAKVKVHRVRKRLLIAFLDKEIQK
jgi:DNA-directed RNA polymerase specialized sigma24 family protein